MAAHVLTALTQISDNPQRELPHLPAALKLSCWTDDLELADYINLDQLVVDKDANKLGDWARRMRDKYRKQWVDLGQPTTREEWILSLGDK